MTEEFGFDITFIYTVQPFRSNENNRKLHTKEEILNGKELGMIKCINIRFISGKISPLSSSDI
jgi:hypothetical protein